MSTAAFHSRFQRSLIIGIAIGSHCHDPIRFARGRQHDLAAKLIALMGFIFDNVVW